MASRQKEWARRARARLVACFGGECCKANGHCNGQLEFDCIIPQGDEHHRKDTSARMSFYHKQHRIGNLQLLCSFHHALKSTQDKREYYQGQDFFTLENGNNCPF